MYKIYQVGPNETIESIANKIGISVLELRRINGIGENSNIINGSYIIIPNDNMMTEDYQKYIIKNGDTMYSIAKENNTDIDTLITLNGLNKNDYIYPNQEILVPNKNIYIVKENDTIKEIVDKLNINVEKIKDLYLIPDQTIIY